MKTLAFVNLKGGVGKTVSAANMAHILASVHNKRVLLVDADKQGNASQYFKLYGQQEGTGELLLGGDLDTESVERAIYHTQFKGLDIITSNMELYSADRALYDQQDADTAKALFSALNWVRDDYDFCVIDNGPSVDTVTLNVLAAADDVLIPIRPDEFSLSGLLDLIQQTASVRDTVNHALRVRGAFFTHWQNRELFRQARRSLEDSGICPVLQTAVNYNPKVPESTLEEMPLCVFAPRSWAAIQYKKLTAEYLGLTDSGQGEEV